MSIRSKMHTYIGISVALIMLISFSFFIISLRSNTRKNATKTVDELVNGYSNQVSNITNKAYGFSESLASSSVYMFDPTTPNKDVLIEDQLTNIAKNNKNFKCIWVSLELSALTPGYSKPSGRRSFLTVPSTDIPFIAVDKDMDSYDPNSLYYIVKNSSKPDIKEPYFYNYYNSTNKDELITTVCYPVIYKGKTLGAAGVDIPISDFQQVIDKINIYPGTEAFLVSKQGFIAAHTTKKLVGKNFENVVDNTNRLDLNQLLNNTQPVCFNIKKDGKTSYTVFVPIKMGENTSWGLFVSTPTSEIFAESKKTVFIAIIVCLLGIAITSIIINILAKKLTHPLNSLTTSIKRLAQGEINENEKLKIETGDEMEEIARSLNVLVEGLNKTAVFAQEIGNGNLNAEHSLLSEKDVMGKSLEEMRGSLIKATEVEVERKKEEEKNNWANQCYASFSELLRKNNDNIHELSHSIVSSLVKDLNINQGGIFILNENQDNEQYLEMTACFAYNRRKMFERRFEVNEGLVGRCYCEGETIYLLEIPDSYITITSGLGDTSPKCLLLVPLKINDEINGVLELASLTPIEEYKVKFVEKIAESIASTISSVRINVHTAELLAQTRQQAEEMAAQEEEMRQNLEELQSTQEEMARVQEEQKKAQEQLYFEKALFNNFLEAVPEAVYFKDKQSRLLRYSRSLAKIHNKKEEELLGKTDFDLFGHSEHAQKAFDDEMDIIKSGIPIFDMVEREDHEDGHVTWVTTNKMPLRDINGNIIGTFGISKDFSKMMELENSLALEQSLFNNFLDTSADFIYFKDLEGRFLKANKHKYEKHGFTNEKQIIGKTDKDLFGEEYSDLTCKEEMEVIKSGSPIINRVELLKDADGIQKWFSISKLPLRDEHGEIIGIWGITRDVTDIKEMEAKLAKLSSENEKVDLN